MLKDSFWEFLYRLRYWLWVEQIAKGSLDLLSDSLLDHGLSVAGGRAVFDECRRLRGYASERPIAVVKEQICAGSATCVQCFCP